MGIEARLDELLESSDLDRLISAAASLAPGMRIAVADADGRVIASAGAPARDAEPAARHSIVADGRTLGSVVVAGVPAADADPRVMDPNAIAAVVALACSLAAGAASSPGVAGDGAGSDGRRQLDAELAIGRRIQRSLMPRRFPDVPGWEVAAAYEAAREVGGDLYDAFLLRDRPDQLAFVVADVTGKGIPAAILMADARALIHAAADHSDDPAVTLERVNRILIAERATSLFVTVAHGVIDGRSGVLTLASAGHDPIHVVRAGGGLESLDPPGRLIGMVADIAATSVRVAIEPGDAIVAHTDGITEARSPDGAFFGEERFLGILSGHAGRSATEIVDAVLADVAAFRGGAEPYDDLTLLVVRRRPVA
jgi:hypothetical protein